MALSINKTWQATYYDGRTARRHDVTVLLNSSGLYITLAGSSSLWWLFENLRVVQGYHSGEPVRLETRAEIPEAIVVEEHSFLEAFLAYAPRQSDAASAAADRLSRSAPLILAGLGLAALMLFGLWRWGIPAFSDAVANRVPASWEDSLGQSVMEQFAPPDRRCENPEALAAIRQIIDRLEAASGNSQTIHLAVADHPMVNAFAAPGGYVVVFRGLLEKTENAEDLAGVLAHELQHVAQRHATRGIVRQLSVASLLAVMAGDTSGMRSMINAAATLGAMKYQREDEEDADADGVRMLRQAGIDANGLWRMLDRMSQGREDVPGALEYVSSHPLTGERVRRLQQLAGPAAPEIKPLFEGKDWHSIAFLCGEPKEREEQPGTAGQPRQ